MLGLYKFENFYLGNISRMEALYLDWKESIYEFDDGIVNTNDNYNYCTILLKINNDKYIDLFHQNRKILIKRNKEKSCFVLNYVEPVGNYYPQDMLNNIKYLTKNQAINYFWESLIEFEENNSKSDDIKSLIYKKNDI